MIKNYFKTAFRNLKRNKTYAFINVLGLSIGIAAALLIFLVIQFETSFDNFHPGRDRIYRVGSVFSTQDGPDYSGGVAFPVGPALRVDFPQIEKVANVYKRDGNQITVEAEGKNKPKKFNNTDVYFAEPEFFSIFKFGWLSGDPKSSLTGPNNVALTKEVAETFFGDWRSAIGKTITRNNKEVYKVSGILENVPKNSDFPLGVVISFSSLVNTNTARNLNDWVSTISGAQCYVVLPAGYSAERFQADLGPFVKKHKPDEYTKDSYFAQPLKTIHSDDRFGNFREHTFSRSLVNALSLIGIFLLVIACVNFINLATAQAVNRSKEVGVRKVLGSSRGQLAIQFLCETAIITIFALVVATLIAWAVLPFLNQLLEVKMTLDLVNNAVLMVFLIGVGIVVTLLSGLYPAMILSGFNPITALKSKITNRMVGGISLRRGLVVLQFAIAQVLIIGTLIVVNQMDFFRNASLGFEKAAIINVEIPGDSTSRLKMDQLRNELAKNPDISNVSFSYTSPSSQQQLA